MTILANIHLSWGLYGWVGLLLIGMAYQVVPMFQVTPEYPMWMKKWLVLSLFSGLLLWSTLQLLTLDNGMVTYPALDTLLQLVIIGGYGSFVITTLRLQNRRKRRIADVTLRFWRLAMYCALLTIGLWLLARLLPAWAESSQYPLLLGILLIPGFGCAVMNGMLYKIVPFLSWFHLQNRQLALQRTGIRLPNMKQFIPDSAVKRQLWTYTLALLATMLSVFWPQWLSYIAAGLFALSCLLLGLNLLTAIRRYRTSYQQLTPQDNPKAG